VITITLSYIQIAILIVALAVFVEIIVLSFATNEVNKTIKFYNKLIEDNHNYYDEIITNSYKRYKNLEKINSNHIKIINDISSINSIYGGRYE